jgi:hypothetical protein
VADGARERFSVVAEGVPGDWMFRSRNAWQNFYWYAELATKERIAKADGEFRAKQKANPHSACRGPSIFEFPDRNFKALVLLDIASVWSSPVRSWQ